MKKAEVARLRPSSVVKRCVVHPEWAQIGAQPAFHGVVLAADFLDTNLCHQLRASMDRGVVEPAEVFQGGFEADFDARRAFSIEIDPTATLAIGARLDTTRDTVAGLSGLSLTDREGSSFLRYLPGGFYRRHRDRAMNSSWPEGARRAVSVVLFLNGSRARPSDDEFSGGELVIFAGSSAGSREAPLRIVPRRGSLVAFPSTMLHEVLRVRAGTRDVVVDWFYE